MFCSKCGTQLNEGSAFCPRCGAQVASVAVEAAAEVSPKSRLAVSLLAIFVGWLGAHRFYMGKIGTALLMLLLGLLPFVCLVLVVVAIAIYSEQEDPPALFLVPWFLMYVFGLAIGIWALVDFIIAVTGNFKDSQGRPIKNW